jgi:hypothetical protein
MSREGGVIVRPALGETDVAFGQRGLRLGVALASLKMTIHGDLALISARELEDWTGITTHTVLR